MSAVKQFLLKKFPTNQYMDCPIPKSYWEIMQEYAEWYALDNKSDVSTENVINSIYKRHKIDLKNPQFDIAKVNEMIYDALKIKTNE